MAAHSNLSRAAALSEPPPEAEALDKSRAARTLFERGYRWFLEPKRKKQV